MLGWKTINALSGAKQCSTVAMKILQSLLLLTVDWLFNLVCLYMSIPSCKVGSSIIASFWDATLDVANAKFHCDPTNHSIWKFMREGRSE